MSLGMESKNRFSRKMLNAFVTAGSQMAQGVLSRFHPKIGMSMTVTYCGMTSTVAGIISVASMAPSTTLPNIGRSLENAYAAATPRTSWKASAPNAYQIVLSSKPADLDADPRIDIVARVGVLWEERRRDMRDFLAGLECAGHHPVQRAEERHRERDHHHDHERPVDPPAGGTVEPYRRNQRTGALLDGCHRPLPS